MCFRTFEESAHKYIWRVVRAVEGAGLENQCTSGYRGFKSLTLRSEIRNIAAARNPVYQFR